MLKFVPNFFINLKKFLETDILNIIYPTICVICGKINNNWLCLKCEKRISKLEENKKIVSQDNIKTFLKFNDEIYFDELFYIFKYKGVIRKLILKYKFSGASYLFHFFVSVILNNKKISEIFKLYDIIIPVPMEQKKKNKRGYNQTELITNNLGFYTRNDILVKVKYTKVQSTLKLEDRRENIKDAFEIKDNEFIKGKNVIVFDDICTTGLTANEISRILKENGVNKILVLVIAKD